LAELLPAQLEPALRELAALGLVTCDAFAAVRRIANLEGRGGKTRRRSDSRPRIAHGPRSAAGPVGRWSLFPGHVEPVPADQRLDRWFRQLLARYGVLFRDLLTRETAAPAWGDLARVLRRWELRGEVSGGRFVSGVGGEQYALPRAVERLRQARDQTPSGEWLPISAADPLNLVGILSPGARLPATHKNAFILRDGQVVATIAGRAVDYLVELDAATRWQMRAALVRARKAPDELRTGRLMRNKRG
jgi:ATP-dependent Lhr-like helicase